MVEGHETELSVFEAGGGLAGMLLVVKEIVEAGSVRAGF